MSYAPSVSTITQAPSDISQYEQIGSAKMMKKVLPMALATLVYRRCNISASCFNSRTSDNVEYFGFSNSRISQPNPICDILPAVNVIPTLIEKQCLLSLVLVIDIQSPKSNKEIFKFTIVYEENENGCDPRAKGLVQAALNFFSHINRLELSEKYLSDDIKLHIKFVLTSEPELNEKLLRRLRPSSNLGIVKAIKTVASFNTQYHNIMIATNVKTEQQEIVPCSTENIIIDLSGDDNDEDVTLKSFTEGDESAQKINLSQNKCVTELLKQIRLDNKPLQKDEENNSRKEKHSITLKRKLKDASTKESIDTTPPKRKPKTAEKDQRERNAEEQLNKFVPIDKYSKPILDNELPEVLPKKAIVEEAPKINKKFKITTGPLKDRTELYSPPITNTSKINTSQRKSKSTTAVKPIPSKPLKSAIKAISNTLAARQANANKSKAKAVSTDEQRLIDSEKFNSEVVTDNEFCKKPNKSCLTSDSDTESQGVIKFNKVSTCASESAISLSDEEFCMNVASFIEGRNVNK